MSNGITTTKLTSKGQIVIPEEIRKSMGLKTGDQFVVIEHGDTVILKAITEPSFEKFETLLKNTQLEAKKAGMKRSDIKKVIEKVRKRK
jgi:AbrB family looped-hinge helix DNA binding protein